MTTVRTILTAAVLAAAAVLGTAACGAGNTTTPVPDNRSVCYDWEVEVVSSGLDDYLQYPPVSDILWSLKQGDFTASERSIVVQMLTTVRRDLNTVADTGSTGAISEAMGAFNASIPDFLSSADVEAKALPRLLAMGRSYEQVLKACYPDEFPPRVQVNG